MSERADPNAERLTILFGSFGVRIFGYALRHAERDVAEEVVSETFLIAWRKASAIPDDALPWLLVVARNVIANHRRSLARRDRLTEELAALQSVMPPAPAVDDSVVDRGEFLRALGSLSELEREALLLTGWDGLTDAQAAQVCGCSPRTFRVRLHRARKRLDRELDEADQQISGTPRHSTPLDTRLEQAR
jgi:RNA polymerase sigma factor (sigma-70 family)